MVLVAGVDEAGRGCVIGPLVIAGVLAQQETLSILTELGVKDSKLLTRKKREVLATEIMRLTRYVVVKLAPAEIDQVVERGRKLHKLNRLEAENMARVIDALEPEEAYVDAADVLEDRFGYHIQECLKCRARVVAKHKADRIYPVVSAASIVAKVERDREISVIAEQFGDFGSGYLTDPKTMVFLRRWLGLHGEYPDFVRKSWKPAKRVKNEFGTQQKTLV